MARRPDAIHTGIARHCYRAVSEARIFVTPPLAPSGLLLSGARRYPTRVGWSPLVRRSSEVIYGDDHQP